MSKIGNRDKSDKPYMTTGEVAAELNMPTRTVTDLARKGKLVRIKLPGMTHYRFERVKVMEVKGQLSQEGGMGVDLEVRPSGRAKGTPKTSKPMDSELIRQHDIRIFKQSNAILNEDVITNIVARLESDLSIKEDHRYQIPHYYLFFRYEYGKWKLTNKYIDSQIQSHFEMFLGSLERLDKFQYFDYENDHLLILWPYHEDSLAYEELRSIPNIDEDSIDQICNRGFVRTYLAKLHPRYERYKKELLDIARAIAKDYETYRATILDKLRQ